MKSILKKITILFSPKKQNTAKWHCSGFSVNCLSCTSFDSCEDHTSSIIEDNGFYWTTAGIDLAIEEINNGNIMTLEDVTNYLRVNNIKGIIGEIETRDIIDTLVRTKAISYHF